MTTKQYIPSAQLPIPKAIFIESATRSPMGQKKLAMLMGDRINEGFFYRKMYGRFAGRLKKSGRNNDRDDRVTRWP